MAVSQSVCWMATSCIGASGCCSEHMERDKWEGHHVTPHPAKGICCWGVLSREWVDREADDALSLGRKANGCSLEAVQCQSHQMWQPNIVEMTGVSIHWGWLSLHLGQTLYQLDPNRYRSEEVRVHFFFHHEKFMEFSIIILRFSGN